MRADTLRRYTAGEARLNSYNHPYVEFYGLAWHDPVDENLAELAWFADDVTPLLVFNAPYTPEQQQAMQQRIALQQRISRYIFRGYLAHWRRQLQAGTREYRKALKLDLHDEGLKFALGIATRHKQQALAALQRQPQDLKALSKLGYIAWNEQQYDAALQRFQQVLAIDPHQAAAYVHLGANYIAQERFAEATAAYQQAGRLNPEYTRLVEQSLDLIQHLQRAHEHPDDPSGYLQLGTIYAADGRSDRAVEMFEKAVALAPSLAAAWLNLALNYDAEERDAEALHAYSRVLLLESDNSLAQNSYEKLALKTALAHRTPTRLALAPDHVLEVDPDHASGYYQLGLRYLRNNEAEAAAAALEQALRLQPDHDAAPLFLGMAYTALRASSKAEAAYRRAIARAPQNAQAYNYLGLVYQQQQRYDQAVKAHQRAIDLAPDYAVAYANLAASYEALGQSEPALLAYDQALQRDASLEFVRDKITALRKQAGR